MQFFLTCRSVLAYVAAMRRLVLTQRIGLPGERGSTSPSSSGRRVASPRYGPRPLLGRVRY
eukprot:963706-Rhodomonas_salina.4